ncbi:Hypothetical protein CINCED_3A013712 [Cinara cedri]|uniref:Uncharacterized protein n=1 Tax=Cinara cedri TaxID=506608 RepID=A0A5E4MXB8_9HEMI|nr:Hypothetical protein CINCED_3A013712 [Cinara cedri]
MQQIGTTAVTIATGPGSHLQKPSTSSSPSPSSGPYDGNKATAMAIGTGTYNRRRPVSAVRHHAGDDRDHGAGDDDDDDRSSDELSDSGHFLAKGAFLITPSNELNLEKATAICEKMNYKGPYSVTRTATGILFKFAEQDDYHVTFRKGFHKVTNSRFYKKVPIPCRPQKTFSVLVYEIPEDIPDEDIRHSLYKFQTVVEVTRLYHTGYRPHATMTSSQTSVDQQQIQQQQQQLLQSVQQSGLSLSGTTAQQHAAPPVVRITLASMEECNVLLHNGLDFYGATFFPVEAASPVPLKKKPLAPNSRLMDLMTTSGHRIRDLLPVFDSAGFTKIPPPSSKVVKPHQ